MTITNPTLVLTYTGSNTTATITSADIVTRSITIQKQLLKDLEPSSNTVSLTIARSCSEVEDIIASESDIKAILKSNGTTVFTGYLSTDYNWTVTANGEQALTIKLEDVGTRLLEKEFISSGYHTFNCTVEAAVTAICTVAGITTATGIVYPVGNVIRGIEGAKTCKELLTSLLKEFNCVYYFNAAGQLLIHEVNCTSTTGIPEFDKTKLFNVGGTGVKLSKKIRQYKNARVTYKTTDTASDYLIYRNTTKDTDSSSTCYLTLSAGQHFDGTEKYTPQTGVTRSPAYIEAVNAASEESLVGSREILAVTSASTDTAGTLGMSATVTVAGGKYLQIDAKNEGTTTGYFSKLDVKGSIIYVKTDNVILTADQQVATTQSNNILEEELVWIHTKTLAQKRANLLAQYHRYGGSTYTFYSSTSVALGSIVRLHEDAISGLDVNVMLIASKETDESDVIEYTAVGVSVFDLTEDVDESIVVEGSSGETQGVPGADAQLFELILGSQTYKRDKRNSGNQAILVTTQVSGYTGSLSVSTIPSGLYVSGVLAIPYNNNYDTITISATYGDAPTQTKVLSVIDTTVYERFLGALSSEPTDASVGFNIVNGDYWIAKSTFSTFVSGTIYEKSNNAWTPISFDGTKTYKFLNCLAQLKQENIELEDLDNQGNVNWFNLIVTDQVIANSMFTNEITMQGDGLIQSESWKDQPTPITTIPDIVGYRLSGNSGLIQANRMEAKDFHAYGDSIIDGNLNNPRLKTFAGGDNQISISNVIPVPHYNLQLLFNELFYYKKTNVSGSIPNVGSFSSIHFDGTWTGIKSIGVYFARNITISNNVLQLYGEFAGTYPSGVTVYVDSPITVTENTTGETYTTPAYYEYSFSTLFSEIGNQRVMFTGVINGTTVTDKNAGYFLYMSSAQDLTVTFPDSTRTAINSSAYRTTYVSISDAIVYTSDDLIKASTILPIGSNKQIGDGTNNFKVYGAVFN